MYRFMKITTVDRGLRTRRKTYFAVIQFSDWREDHSEQSTSATRCEGFQNLWSFWNEVKISVIWRPILPRPACLYFLCFSFVTVKHSHRFPADLTVSLPEVPTRSGICSPAPFMFMYVRDWMFSQRSFCQGDYRLFHYSKLRARRLVAGFPRGGPGLGPGQVMWDLW
jgi:hypothetical protein